VGDRDVEGGLSHGRGWGPCWRQAGTGLGDACSWAWGGGVSALRRERAAGTSCRAKIGVRQVEGTSHVAFYSPVIWSVECKSSTKTFMLCNPPPALKMNEL
jgi:hypothetical protein